MGGALLDQHGHRLIGQLCDHVGSGLVDGDAVSVEGDDVQVWKQGAAAWRSRNQRQGGGVRVCESGHDLEKKDLISDGLTWTGPLGAALFSVHQYGEAQQAAVGRLRGEGAAMGLVKEHQLVVDADVLGALIHNLCVRRLEAEKDAESD